MCKRDSDLETVDENSPNDQNVTRQGDRILELESKEIVHGRDVSFFENEFP